MRPHILGRIALAAEAFTKVEEEEANRASARHFGILGYVNVNVCRRTNLMFKMELTSDLIAVQSILSSLIKNNVELSRINYAGGNEDLIMKVLVEMEKFLKSRGYMLKSDEIDEKFDNELKDIVLFLALNTTFDYPIELAEYSHLINITPSISKCIFANVVYGLDLCKYYCHVIDIFPLHLCVKLLEEIPQCLEKSVPNAQLKNASLFLKSVALKLSKTNFSSKVEDDIDNLCKITFKILQDLLVIKSNHLKNFNRDKMYTHLGLCLLSLFKILEQCDPNCLSLNKFIKNMIGSCSDIVKLITIDVFCTWAEADVDDENLQTLVSYAAYSFIEIYQKVPEAKQLINMLGSFAKKPQSLSEQIRAADTHAMIRKINKKDRDQKNWFKALLRNNFFQTKEAVECIRTWLHLCDAEDSLYLSEICLEKNTEESIKIFLKCGANLSLDQLITVSTKHFYKQKFLNLCCKDTETSLTWLLNKIKKEEDDLDDNLAKDILLLFIQRPETVLISLYEECLKNTFYPRIFKGSFNALKHIIKINNFGVILLLQVAEERMITLQNVDKYIELLKMLLEINYFSSEDVSLKILCPLLQKYYSESLLEEVNLVLQIFLGTTLTFTLRPQTGNLVKLLLIIMNENRCKFTNFDGLKQEIAKHTVDICCDLCKPSYNSGVNISIDDEDCFTRYYRLSLNFQKESSLFRSLCDEFDIEDYGCCVNALLKVMPTAVSREWLMISQEIIETCGYDKCLELLTDLVIILSQLVATQNIETNAAIFLALKYCLQNYGLVIQQKLSPNATSDIDINITKQVCRVLAKLPDPLRNEESLSLVNILSNESLKVLGKDKDFLCQLMLIKNTKMRQILVQKITE